MVNQIDIAQLDDKTRGSVLALDQMFVEFKKQVEGLKERSGANEGGRQAAVVISKRLEDLSKLIINSAKGDNPRDPAEVKLVIEGVHRAVQMARDVGQDYLQEALLLKGEARALQAQIETIVKRRNELAAHSLRTQAEREEDEKAKSSRGKPKRKSSRKKSTKEPEAARSNGTDAG